LQATSVTSIELPITQKLAWDYIVNFRECESWMKPEETEGLAILV